MRFQTYGSYAAPTPSAIHAMLNGGSVGTKTYDFSMQPSGESGIIVPGGSAAMTINLERLLVSWGGLETAGRLEVSASADKPLCVLFQSVPSGFQVIPFDEVIIVGEYGLQCTSNSTGGEYTVTAYYYVEVA